MYTHLKNKNNKKMWRRKMPVAIKWLNNNNNKRWLKNCSNRYSLNFKSFSNLSRIPYTDCIHCHILSLKTCNTFSRKHINMNFINIPQSSPTLPLPLKKKKNYMLLVLLLLLDLLAYACWLFSFMLKILAQIKKMI